MLVDFKCSLKLKIFLKCYSTHGLNCMFCVYFHKDKCISRFVSLQWFLSSVSVPIQIYRMMFCKNITYIKICSKWLQPSTPSLLKFIAYILIAKYSFWFMYLPYNIPKHIYTNVQIFFKKLILTQQECCSF